MRLSPSPQRPIHVLTEEHLRQVGLLFVPLMHSLLVLELKVSSS